MLETEFTLMNTRTSRGEQTGLEAPVGCENIFILRRANG